MASGARKAQFFRTAIRSPPGRSVGLLCSAMLRIRCSLLVEYLEELLDPLERLFLPLAGVDHAIAITLQRFRLRFSSLPGRNVAATASGPTSSLTIPRRLQSSLSL